MEQANKDLPKGILSIPDSESFELGAREKRLLQALFDWHEQSAKTHWVLGEPLEV